MKTVLFILFFLSFILVSNLFAQNIQKTSIGLITDIHSVKIEVQFFSPEIVRIIKYPKGNKYEKKSLSVIKVPGKVSFSETINENLLTVSSKSLQINIDRVSGVISFYDNLGKLLLKEEEGSSQFSPVKDVDKNSYEVSQAFHLKQDEAIYGLGQDQKGKMNHRNTQVKLMQGNTHICIPFFQSVKGYGVFWDNYSTTIYKDANNVSSFNSNFGDGVDYYFIQGGSADKVIAGMRKLTGQAPMFPLWTYGFWQSRQRYMSQSELVEVVKKFRVLKVPIDCIVQDWQYWGNNANHDTRWNSMVFQKPFYSNPRSMVDSVHLLNAHIIISVWPNFGEQSEIYKELMSKGMLFDFNTWPNVAKVYDAFNPDARKIYWKYAQQNIFSLGMDGWWLDANEPEQREPWGKVDSSMTYLGSFQSVRNAYPLMATSVFYENQRKLTSNKRVFILTRSAFAGQQRNATMTWSGDITASWNVMRNQISGGVNLSLTGIPYWNSDIGGVYMGNYPKEVKDTAFHELYVRWMQFAEFTPMFRSHNSPREIFMFGKKGYWAYDIIEKYTNLRYRLLPYIYSNAWAVTSGASTMMRGLMMDFISDSKVHNINNEFMFGKSFLVCPVTDSLYVSRTPKGIVTNFSTTKTKSVYLPKGCDWFDFWTCDRMKGGQTITRDVPIDIIPVYVKAGSIIPLGHFQQYSDEKKPDSLEVRIYEGENGQFVLYEDEGDNYNYEKGVYATINFEWNDTQKVLTIGRRNGKYPGMLQSRTFRLILVGNGRGKGIEEDAQASKTVKYDGNVIKVKLN